MTPVWKKRFILIFGLFENLIFTGTILGWSALNYMLKSEGVYEHLCITPQVEYLVQDAPASSSILYEPNVTSILSTYTSNRTRQRIRRQDSGLDYDYEDESPAIPPPRNDNFRRPGPPTSSALPPAWTTIMPGAINDTRAGVQEFPALQYASYLASLPTPHVRNASSPSNSGKKDDKRKLGDIAMARGSVDRPTRKLSITDELKAEGMPNLYPAPANEPTSRQSSSQSASTTSSARIGGCTKQDAMLNLAYTIGSFAMGFSSFIWGFLLDRWGLRTVRNIINVLITAGTGTLCFTSRDRSWLVFPAVTLLSLAGVPLRIANMQLANYYPKRRSTIITFYSGAFSASAVIFVLLKALYDWGVLGFFGISMLLVIFSLIMFPFTFLALPKHKVVDEETDSNKPATESGRVEQPRRKPSETPSQQILFRGKRVSDVSLKETFAHINPVALEKYANLGSPTQTRKATQPKVLTSPVRSPIPPASTLDSGASSIVRKLPLRASLTSIPYLLHQFWYSWLLTYMIMYVGSMNLWLDRTTDDINKASNMVKVYGIVQILALVLAPLAGLFMDWMVERANREEDPFEQKLKRAISGFWPLTITHLSLVLILICRFFNSETAIYASIVFITMLRSFLIAVASAYLRIRFPADHFNRLLGIMSTVGSIFTLLQFPLFVWESQSPSNALYVNLVNAALTAVALLNPLHLIIGPLQRYFISKEEEQLKRSNSARYSTSSDGSRGQIIRPSPTLMSFPDSSDGTFSRRQLPIAKNMPAISTISNEKLYNVHNKNVNTLPTFIH